MSYCDTPSGRRWCNGEISAIGLAEVVFGHLTKDYRLSRSDHPVATEAYCNGTSLMQAGTGPIPKKRRRHRRLYVLQRRTRADVHALSSAGPRHFARAVPIAECRFADVRGKNII